MADYKRMRFLDRFLLALRVWKTMRRSKSFGSITVEEFEKEVLAEAESRERVATAAKALKQARADRALAQRRARDVLQRFVNSVRGDPSEGDAGEVYRALGYVAGGERRRPIPKHLSSKRASPK